MSHPNQSCKQENVNEAACYLRFGPGKVVGAIALKWETVRGETLVVDLIEDQDTNQPQIVGLELFKPGMKPCQPVWDHSKDWDPTKLLPEQPHPEAPPLPSSDEEDPNNPEKD